MSEAKLKRWRTPVAKPGQLIARYGREEGWNKPSLVYAWGAAGASKRDSIVLMSALEGVPVHGGKSLREELTSRGYDITTLRFSIELASPSPAQASGSRKTEPPCE